MAHRIFGQNGFRQFLAFLQALRPGDGGLIDQHFFQAAVEAALQDRAFVIAVFRELFDLGAFDRQRALIFIDAAAREDAHLNDRARHARRQLQRGVANVGRLLTEDGAEEFFLRRHRRFAFRRHLTDQDIARLHFRADIDDAGFIEVLQRLFADIRDVAGDLFLAQLGVAGHDLEFFDMD